MRRMLLAALVVLAPGLAAQETPEQVVERYYQTFRTGDFAANAAIMHPTALEELKTTMLGFAELPGATEEEAFGQMFGVRTVEELRAMPAAAVFERMMRSQLGNDEMREVLSGTRIDVLGHVMEGDTTAHVVYRMEMGIAGQTINQVQVVPLKRADGQWRVLLTGSFAGLMNAVPRPQHEDE